MKKKLSAIFSRPVRKLVFFLVMGLAAVSVRAADQDIKLLGAGVVFSQSPYRGADDRIIPVPVVKWAYKGVYIRGLEAGYYLLDRSPFKFAALVKPRMMGYHSSDSDSLGGMEDRENSFDAGFSLDYDLPAGEGWSVGARAVQDVSGRHDGFESQLSVSKLLASRIWRLTPEVGVRFQSADMTDYYYGVRAEEVRAGRPEYTADGVLNPFAGALFVCGISRNWVVVSSIEAEWLGHEINRSPVVDKDLLLGGIVGLARRF